MGEDGPAADRVAALLHGPAAQQIHSAAEALLEFLLHAAHLEKSRRRPGQKRHEQIHIAACFRGASGDRTEQFHTSHRAALTNRAHHGPQRVHGGQFRQCLRHVAGMVAPPRGLRNARCATLRRRLREFLPVKIYASLATNPACSK